MFEGQFIGWQDQCGEEIHCGDRVILSLPEVAEFIAGTPRYEVVMWPGKVEYDTISCAFVVQTDDGPAFHFGEFDQSEIQVTR